MEKENILSELRKNIQEDKFIKIVFSDRQNGEFNKIIIKSLSLKNGKNIQIESFKDNKAFHKNIELDNFQEIEDILKGYMENFKQILLQIENLDISFIKKKESFTKKENKNNLIKNYIEHNKKKQYILNEGDKIDFLIELGLMSTEGKILKSKKLIDNHINVLDFGCGKSYLTFALYYYLKNYRKDLSFSIVGLDLKKDVIEFCNKLAQKLNYENLEFLNGNIKDYDRAKEVDLVFSLHACNNATDYSLEKALSLNAKAILAVPCCHHEFFEKIQKNKDSKFYNNLKIMADNGIVLDKFASLATDSFRSLILELCGYKTKMIEFIDMEHTPKNILIRAIKSKSSNLKEKLKEYNRLKEFLGIQPLLEDLAKKYFLIDTNTEIPYN
ncbi:SAM-dependent methyltransferase [Fusobacterium polymorphum]|uniref:SAM-dependent methyltransferase n=1 Tax=Fusobacterium nucleatum subsp. polymorphum TaxID=76857 RepID=A0A2C6BW61_FUSNP|nr:SAM-dependent methyltransferase [Fusobacterium polymorphum]PHI08092.1 SAM-dependent methyltransferase [Fusobacterium polymorphum]